MDGWNTTFPLRRPIFRGELLVSGRAKVIKSQLSAIFGRPRMRPLRDNPPLTCQIHMSSVEHPERVVVCKNVDGSEILKTS